MSGMRKRGSQVKSTSTTTTINGVLRYVKRQSVSTYRSMVSDLRHLRTVHSVEHYPCLPDPQRVSGTTECGTVHYGFCVPVTLEDDLNVSPTPNKIDPVRLLSSPDLEGHLKSLVDHFVARDKASQAKNGKSRSQSPASPRSNTAAFSFNCSLAKVSPKSQVNSGGSSSSGGGSGPNSPQSAEETLGQLILDMKAAVGNSNTVVGGGGGGQLEPQDNPQIKVKNGEFCLQSPVDYAKRRFQLSQDVEAAEKKVNHRVPLNGVPHLVSEAKTKFENGIFNQVDVRWKSEWLPNNVNAVVHRTDANLSPTLAKYNFMLHPDDSTARSNNNNKPVSPEPLAGATAVVSPQLPHPKLTSIQKQHIRERALSPPAVNSAAAAAAAVASVAGNAVAGGGGGGSFPVKPFLTKGSVAERVLIFERCPVLDRGLNRTHQHYPSKPLFNTWKGSGNHAGASDHAVTDVKQKVKGNEKVLPLNSVSPPPSNNKEPPQQRHHQRSSHHHHHQPQQQRRQRQQLPCFYYPCGRPVSSNEIESQLNRVAQVFARFDRQEVPREQFGVVVKACGLPLYWKVPVFNAAVAATHTKDYVSLHTFLDFWKRILNCCYDLPSKFVNILTWLTLRYLLPDDFISLIQKKCKKGENDENGAEALKMCKKDVIDSHLGLTFLKEAEEFHSRYVQTVIARIYYCVNRSWSGRISIPELRKSNFLQVLSLLEEEDDINQITEYFSYEHFYVIYCKFWELDKDHDLLIDRNDLGRHNDGAISARMINRIFCGAVTRGKAGGGKNPQPEDKLSYPEFVWFLLSEEDKRHSTSIEYWFRCMDLDGDGFLSMYELEYFYEEQLQRMDALGIEALPFQDCLCQMLDMILPKVPGKISLSDLKRCKMTPIFFDTFFNLEKYLDHEQKDPFAFQRDQDGDLNSETSDWNRFASQEYELLVAEEGAADQDEMLYDDDFERDELVVHMGNMTVDDKNGLRTSSNVQNKSTLEFYANDDDYADYAESDDYQY